MSQPLLIVGAGGHAKMVIEAARSQGAYEPFVCVASDASGLGSILNVQIIAESDDSLRALRGETSMAFVAIGSNWLRRKLSNQLELLGYSLATIVADGAWLSPSAQVGDGSVLMPRCVVGAQTSIGKGSIINTAATVDHDCEIGDFVHIGPGSHLAGGVEIGADSFLGVGCSVIPQQRIGPRSTVGAGAVVISDIPHDQTWVGCPAQCLKPKSSNKRYAHRTAS